MSKISHDIWDICAETQGSSSIADKTLKVFWTSSEHCKDTLEQRYPGARYPTPSPAKSCDFLLPRLHLHAAGTGSSSLSPRKTKAWPAWTLGFFMMVEEQWKGWTPFDWQLFWATHRYLNIGSSVSSWIFQWSQQTVTQLWLTRLTISIVHLNWNKETQWVCFIEWNTISTFSWTITMVWLVGSITTSTKEVMWQLVFIRLRVNKITQKENRFHFQ